MSILTFVKVIKALWQQWSYASILSRDKRLFSTTFRLTVGPTQPPIQLLSVAYSLGLRRRGYWSFISV